MDYARVREIQQVGSWRKESWSGTLQQIERDCIASTSGVAATNSGRHAGACGLHAFLVYTLDCLDSRVKRSGLRVL